MAVTTLPCSWETQVALGKHTQKIPPDRCLSLRPTLCSLRQNQNAESGIADRCYIK